jgi:hypothetical protein
MGLQFSYSVSEWLLVLFAFLADVALWWGRAAALSVLPENPFLAS